MAIQGGNDKWRSLSDVCPNNRFEIEEALIMAKKGEDWRETREAQDKAEAAAIEAAKKHRGKPRALIFFGELFQSVADCAAKTEIDRKTIRKWANNANKPDVYFIEDADERA